MHNLFLFLEFLLGRMNACSSSLLVCFKTGWTPCIEASRVGNLKILKILMGDNSKKVKADINQVNDFGWHGLIEACRNSNYDVVEYSIENGVEVNKVDMDGEIAMDHASEPWIRGLLQVSSFFHNVPKCFSFFILWVAFVFKTIRAVLVPKSKPLSLEREVSPLRSGLSHSSPRSKS
jgi:hypothetical protein